MYHPADKARQRREEALKRGLDPDKRFDIVLISGSGGVGKEAITTITNRLPLFLRPVEHIYLVGREEKGSVEKRELISIQGNELANAHGPTTSVQPKRIQDLEEILQGENEKIAFFTLDNNEKGETNRAKLSANNIPLLESIAPYIPPHFKGNFNIVSNLVEVLATRASEIFPIDARLISGNTGIDMLRAKEFLKNILPRQDYFDIELGISGFHDQQYISLDATKIITHTITLANGKEEANYVSLKEVLRNNPAVKGAVIEYLTNAAKIQFSLDNKYYEAKKEKRIEGSTIVPTGRAIADFAQAVVNRTKTIASIPTLIKGKWYYVTTPVDFKKGYPLEDTSITNNFTQADKAQIIERILAPRRMYQPDSLNTILLETRFHTNANLHVKPPQESTIELDETFQEQAKSYTYASASANADWEELQLRETLQNKLCFELALISGVNQNCFHAYRYACSDQATARTYQIQLQGKTIEEKKQLLEKTTIQRIIADDSFFYIAGVTESKSKEKATIRVQQIPKFNGHQGENILFFEQTKPYAIEDMIKTNDAIYVLQFQKDHHNIAKFNKRGKEELRIETNEKIYGLFNHQEKIFLVGEDYIYSLQGKEQVRIAENVGGREFFVLPEHQLLITAGFNNATIIHLQSKQQVQYQTKKKIGGLVANHKELQLITKHDDGFVIREFHQPEDIFKKQHNERMLAIQRIADANKIIVPEKNLLISFLRPDKAYATIHNKNGHYTSRLDDITTFNLFGGYWR